MTISSDTKLLEQLRADPHASGISPSGGFAYDLDLSLPFVTTAIHSGHQVRPELLPLMAASDAERLYEEDAATEQIIRHCPSRVWALDSRAEYDLNRSPDAAIPLTPEMFWGLQVYLPLPSEAMQIRSLKKYHEFYAFFAAVVEILLDRFGCCLVYDVHSYNIGRQQAQGHPSPPLFNLGTAEIDRNRWKESLEDWLEELARITVPGRSVTVAENIVFQGQGNFCQRLKSWSADILVLPTEISKFYMDEQRGTVDSKMVEVLASGLGSAVQAHGQRFGRVHGRDC